LSLLLVVSVVVVPLLLGTRQLARRGLKARTRWHTGCCCVWATRVMVRRHGFAAAGRY